jgi:hypothetical protein
LPFTCKEIRLPRLMKVKDDAATLKKAAPDLLANAQSSADPKKSVEDLCKRIDEFTPQVHAMVERASKPWEGRRKSGKPDLRCQARA